MINMISVVIPVMNESENIAHLVPKIYSRSYDIEVLLVDVKDGSSDGTGKVVAKLKNT
jgi:glycosyltransferase involved in cell wall biosynthesis